MRINIYAPRERKGSEHMGYEISAGNPVRVGSEQVMSEGQLLKKLVLQTNRGDYVELCSQPHGDFQFWLPGAQSVLEKMATLLRGMGRTVKII